jgi:membrane protease subunit HflK
MNWDWEKLKQQQRTNSPWPPLINDYVEKIKNIKLPGSTFIILLLIVVGILGLTSVYTVKQNEIGVVQRFGRWVRNQGPGLSFKIPFGIEKVTKVNVMEFQTEEFGTGVSRAPDQFTKRSRFGSGANTANVALMLTGDLNVAQVPWIVQFRVKDPKNFLFKVRDVRRLLIDMSEATMRLVVGDRSINEVINKRKEIADEAKILLQKEMDQAEAGILVNTVELKKTNVPAPVQPSFNEVNQATQQKEQIIYQAKEDYNKAIPAARGQAQRTVKIAEGYALNRVNRAEGDAARFKAVYKEYIKARDVTKRRLYLETLKVLFPKLGPKYIIDSDQKNLLPLLNLGKTSGIGK